MELKFFILIKITLTEDFDRDGAKLTALEINIEDAEAEGAAR
jgi:hypothetical protein